MFAPKGSFSSFSVDDVARAREFYGQTLGLAVSDGAMGTLELAMPEGHRIFVYPKDNHEPATFTVLNLVVDDVEVAVDELNAVGVQTKIYDDPNLPTDAKGIARGMGPDIAWFKDPAGNVISVINPGSAAT
ncbi:VOC family protein [uncultured Arthrobacter sp.]|uniref:VOC family protein n=1 Tax=uncultured Arthrobacter sp. TaxID=114050 RepID=UPI0028D1D9D6|nr:VOC family protein [uncultured Arthrobacter sp.]